MPYERRTDTISITDDSINLTYELDVIRHGNPDGIPCLILGPSETYLWCMPDELKKHIEFISVIDYWNINTRHAVSENDIDLDKLIHDIELYQEGLKNLTNEEKYQKTLLFGPSAVGLIGMEFAKRHPDRVHAVINMGAPFNMKGLSEDIDGFLDSNYNPKHPWNKDNETAKEMWAEIQRKKSQHDDRNKEIDMLNPDEKSNSREKYYAELNRDSETYYATTMFKTSTQETMRSRWVNFNINTRKKFFEIVSEHFIETDWRGLAVPVYNAMGLYDGCCSVARVIETLSSHHDDPNPSPNYPKPHSAEGNPEGFFYYDIIAKSAHLVSVDAPNEFTTNILTFLEDTGFMGSNVQDEGALSH